MHGSSFEKFNYALRPAKNMERKMFCEALARLSRISSLASYRYIGFGALGFHDFCLFHQRLGINDMVSIEGNLAAQDRIAKNKPYSCIKMKWGMSHEVLPTLQQRTAITSSTVVIAVSCFHLAPPSLGFSCRRSAKRRA